MVSLLKFMLLILQSFLQVQYNLFNNLLTGIYFQFFMVILFLMKILILRLYQVWFLEFNFVLTKKGDVIVRVLAISLRAKYVVFLSNMAGIYTLPPTTFPEAKLIPDIIVHSGVFEMPEIERDARDGKKKLSTCLPF